MGNPISEMIFHERTWMLMDFFLYSLSLIVIDSKAGQDLLRLAWEVRFPASIQMFFLSFVITFRSRPIISVLPEPEFQFHSCLLFVIRLKFFCGVRFRVLLISISPWARCWHLDMKRMLVHRLVNHSHGDIYKRNWSHSLYKTHFTKISLSFCLKEQA